ncbi:MAG: integrase [Candidatus Nanoarchaeia archaeon]
MKSGLTEAISFVFKELNISPQPSNSNRTSQNNASGHSQSPIQQDTKHDALILKSIYEKNVHIYEKYLNEKLNNHYARLLFLTTQKFFVKYNVKSIDEMKKIMRDGKIGNKSGAAAYRNLLNFIEDNTLLDIDVIDKYRRKIKIPNTNGFDRHVPTKEQIKYSLKQLKEHDNFLLHLIYRFLLETGCRFTEASHFFKTFDETQLEIIGNVCIYSNFYIRRNKSSYYLLFTKSLYDSIKEHMRDIDDMTMKYLTKKCQRTQGIECVKYLRKVHFSLLIMNEIPFEIADLMAGRSQSKIGINHYLSQKEVLVKYYKQVVDKFLEFNE